MQVYFDYITVMFVCLCTFFGYIEPTCENLNNKTFITEETKYKIYEIPTENTNIGRQI